MSRPQISHSKGMIVLSKENVPLFIFSIEGQDVSSIRFYNFICVATGVTRQTFNRFIAYAERFGAMERGNNYAKCDLTTFKLLYQEFEKIEFNQAMTSVLFAINIFPPLPEVEELDFHVVSVESMFWIEKARNWLRKQFCAGFLKTKVAPRQMTN